MADPDLREGTAAVPKPARQVVVGEFKTQTASLASRFHPVNIKDFNEPQKQALLDLVTLVLEQ